MNSLKLRTKVNILLTVIMLTLFAFSGKCLAGDALCIDGVFIIQETFSEITVNNEDNIISGVPWIEEDGKYLVTFSVQNACTYEILVDGMPWHNIRTSSDDQRGADGFLVKGFEEDVITEATKSKEVLESYDNYRPLVGGVKYTFEFDSSKPLPTSITFRYQHGGTAGDTEDTQIVTEELRKNVPKGFFESIEELMAELIMSMAKVLNWMVSAAIKQTLTIDDIVFNLYDEIKLDYWNPKSTSSIIQVLRNPINTWYSIFQSIALVGYMTILVYVGIKRLLQSTTASKKANYKKTLVYWVVGIAVLFFMPFYMKNIIVLNDAFVTQIADSRTEAAKKATRASLNLEAGYLSTDFDNVIDFDSGSDYMTIVGRMAEETKKLGLAAAYMMMMWQLVVMIVYYYKRVFITGFLIVIFPLIAFTFVWDKLNDGKSQALSAWLQEFTIGIFVQSFHAIIFVFVCNTIYSTISSDGKSIDFILVMIASSFLFSGEEILKQIFGGSGTKSVGSLSDTAGKVALTTAVATNVGARVIKNAVGATGAVRQAAGAIRNFRTNRFLGQQDGTGKTNFDKIAARPTIKRNVSEILPETTSTTYPPEMRELAEVAATLNDNRASSEEMAWALSRYKELSAMYKDGTLSPEQKRMYDEIMSKCRFTPNQLENLGAAVTASAVMASSGNYTTRQISQHLKMEVEIIFPSDKAERNLPDKMFKAALINMRDYGASRRVTEDQLRDDWNENREKLKSYDENIHFATDEGRPTKNQKRAQKYKANARIEASQKEFIAKYKQKFAGKQIDEKRLNSIAKSVAIAKNLGEEGIDEYDVDEALSKIDDKKDTGLVKELWEISEIGEDYSTYRNEINKRIAGDVKGRRDTSSAINVRANGLMEEIKKAHDGEQLDEKTLFEACKSVATVEHLEKGRVTANEARTAFSTIDGFADNDMMEEILSRSNIRGEYETIRYVVSKKIITEFVGTPMGKNERKYHREETIKWGEETSKKVENDVSARVYGGMRNNTSVLDDPYRQILNILEGASRNGNIHTSTVSEIYDNSDLNLGDNSRIFERIMSETRTQNQRELIAGMNFAKEALKAPGIYEEPKENLLYNGMTFDEIKKQKDIALKNAFMNIGKISADIVVGGAAGFIGMTAGMATADDGIPLGEAAKGLVGGAALGATVSEKVVPWLVDQKERDKEEKKIESAVEKRLNRNLRQDEVTDYRNSRAEHMKSNAETSENLIIIDGLHAQMHQEADGNLSASVIVQARNADYVYVSESPVFPSTGWLPYQDSVLITFADKDPTKSHDIYAYVKDKHGNVKGARLTNITM